MEGCGYSAWRKCVRILTEGCVDSGWKVLGFWWKNVWILGERCGDSGGRMWGFWWKEVLILDERCTDSGGNKCGFWRKSVRILTEGEDSDRRECGFKRKGVWIWRNGVCFWWKSMLIPVGGVWGLWWEGFLAEVCVILYCNTSTYSSILKKLNCTNTVLLHCFECIIYV